MLNRAWEVCKACINAHAIVDREEDETIKQSRAAAWADLADGFLGKGATGTYRGIIGELYDSVPEGLEDALEQIVLEAHHLALGQLAREAQAALQARDEFPQLKLVWNRDHEDMEH